MADSIPCSILVPVFNGENNIKLHLPSILRSARAIDQIVIVNDGSTDRSLEILKGFAKADSRIEILNREHTGLVGSLNNGLQSCTHELVARADIDDSYAENRILLQVSHMTLNESLGATFTDYRVWTADSRFLGEIVSAIHPALTQLSLISSSRTPHPGVMFRKTHLQEAGGYRIEDFPAEDLALWIRMSKISQIDSIPIPLLDYTLSPHGISAQSQIAMNIKLGAFQQEIAHTLDLSLLSEASSIAVKSYANYRESDARIFSLIRDLYILSKFLEGSKRRQASKIIPPLILSLDPASLLTARKMHYYRNLRDKYRTGFFK